MMKKLGESNELEVFLWPTHIKNKKIQLNPSVVPFGESPSPKAPLAHDSTREHQRWTVWMLQCRGRRTPVPGCQEQEGSQVLPGCQGMGESPVAEYTASPRLWGRLCSPSCVLAATALLSRDTRAAPLTPVPMGDSIHQAFACGLTQISSCPGTIILLHTSSKKTDHCCSHSRQPVSSSEGLFTFIHTDPCS